MFVWREKKRKMLRRGIGNKRLCVLEWLGGTIYMHKILKTYMYSPDMFIVRLPKEMLTFALCSRM